MSLWKVDDQAQRLRELTSHDPDLKEAPLRRDVRSLGCLLGEVLKEQVGTDLFAAVEELRLLLIQHREQQPATENHANERDPLLDRAEEIVGRLNINQAHQMT